MRTWSRRLMPALLHPPADRCLPEFERLRSHDRRRWAKGAVEAQLTVGPVHDIRLSVNDLERSRAFYTEVLGFEVA
ncbi:MAG TPA: VOC family protein, partial [Acidimicrobiia bacterium]